MSDIPARPTFPKGCTISLLILVGMFLITLVINKFTEKKDPKDPKKNITNPYIGLTFFITIILFALTAGGCGWWYSMKRRNWIYNYGSDTEKAVQLATDVLDVFKN